MANSRDQLRFLDKILDLWRGEIPEKIKLFIKPLIICITLPTDILQTYFGLTVLDIIQNP